MKSIRNAINWWNDGVTGRRLEAIVVLAAALVLWTNGVVVGQSDAGVKRNDGVNREGVELDNFEIRWSRETIVPITKSAKLQSNGKRAFRYAWRDGCVYSIVQLQAPGSEPRGTGLMVAAAIGRSRLEVATGIGEMTVPIVDIRDLAPVQKKSPKTVIAESSFFDAIGLQVPVRIGEIQKPVVAMFLAANAGDNSPVDWEGRRYWMDPKTGAVQRSEWSSPDGKVRQVNVSSDVRPISELGIQLPHQIVCEFFSVTEPNEMIAREIITVTYVGKTDLDPENVHVEISDGGYFLSADGEATRLIPASEHYVRAQCELALRNGLKPSELPRKPNWPWLAIAVAGFGYLFYLGTVMVGRNREARR